MDPVVVVGGGLSGVACARVLVDAGYDVVLLDRGRRLGGRMAVRTLAGRAVDVGASYLTVGDGRFRAVVEDWADRGLARPWTDTFAVVEEGKPARSTRGPVRWSAPHGLRSLVEDLAEGITAVRHTVTQVSPTRDGAVLVDGLRARAVALAMPDPQARRMLPSHADGLLSVLTDSYQPVLALSAGWSRRSWSPDFDGAFVAEDETLAWVADDGRRRGDAAPVLVAHSTVALAAEHLSAPETAERSMLDRLTALLGIPNPPEWTHLQRWSFARPAGSRPRTHHLGPEGVGLCGDAWSARPRVEAAYLSGLELGRAIAAACSGPTQRG